MAKYPVEHTDSDGTNDAVNYLLSGPAGLGQNFKGFSTYFPSDLTGNFRPPFTIAAPTSVAYANLYVPPIPLSTSEKLSGNTWKFNFATPMAPPFALGQGPFVNNVVTAIDTVVLDDPDAFTIDSGTKATSALPVTYTNVATTVLTGSGSGLVLTITVGDGVAAPYTTFNTGILATASGTGWASGDTVKVLGTALGGATPANDLYLTIDFVTSLYDGDYYNGPGVVECTTDYVILRTQSNFPDPGPGTGGTISLSSMGFDMSTDCNAKVTVSGGTDRVFISGQLNGALSYITSEPTDLTYRVRVNRLKGFITDDPTNPEYRFSQSVTIAEKTFNFTGLEPTTNQIALLEITSGTNHVPRTTFPRVYNVTPSATSGAGVNAEFAIEIRPNIAQSTTGLSSGGPYFTPGPAATYRDAPWNDHVVTNITGSGTEATVTVTSASPDFIAGQSIRLTDCSPYNGTYRLTSATSTTLKFDTTETGTFAPGANPTAQNAFFNVVITITNAGEGFEIGDTITISGADIGGAEGINDLVLTVTNVTTPASSVTQTAEVDAVFTAIIDEPDPGYYWYLIEVRFDSDPSDAEVTSARFGYRSFSAQVVKE